MSNFNKNELNQFAETFKALSNPNRLSIFLKLVSCCVPGLSCDSKEGMRRCVGELGQTLGIAPSTVSHHIKELRRSGLIRVERRGKNIECWVDEKKLSDLSKFFCMPSI